MVAILGAVVFASGVVVAMAVIVGMVAPQWERIFRLASGQGDVAFAPLAQLAVAERRIAVRRWSTERHPAFDVNWRRAAA